MELNWTTFVLEIINFLVLLWILKRFLYRPVLQALHKRQQTIQQQLDKAAQLEAHGMELEQQYHNRMESWQREKQQARDVLHREIDAERIKKLADLEQELAGEKAKAAVIEQRRKAEMQQLCQHSAHQQGARFAAKLLSAVAGPEVERQLVDFLIQSLDQLEETQLVELRDNCAAAESICAATSAFALSDSQKQLLKDKLQTICQQPIQLEWHEDLALIAGLRLTIGALVLQLNVANELKGFADLSHDHRTN